MSDGERTAGPSRAEAKALPFEAALEELESIVDRLEGGSLELEEALSVFEAGVKLSRSCAVQLDAAERRIELLVDREGGPGLQDFEADAALEADDGDDEFEEDGDEDEG